MTVKFNILRKTTPTPFPESFVKVPGISTLLNPGDLINLHKNSKLIMPIWLDGVHMNITKMCTLNTIANVNFSIGHGLPSGIRVGAKYSKPTSQKNITKTPVFMIDVNPLNLSGNVELLYHVIPSVRIKCHHQFSPTMTAQEYSISENIITLDHVGKQSSSSCVLSNARLDQGRFILSSMHSVLSGFAMGAELLWEWNKGNQVYFQPALAARYAGEDFGYSGTLSTVAFELFFWRRIHESFQVGSMTMYNERTKLADGSIYCQWVHKDSTMRGMVDSNSAVGMTYTRRLGDLSANLGVSLLVNIPQKKWTYGIKFDYDSSF